MADRVAKMQYSARLRVRQSFHLNGELARIGNETLGVRTIGFVIYHYQAKQRDVSIPTQSIQEMQKCLHARTF